MEVEVVVEPLNLQVLKDRVVMDSVRDITEEETLVELHKPIVPVLVD